MSILNLSAYKFVTIEDGPAWRPLVTERCNALGLKGTILLAPEGINLFIAGPIAEVREFIDYIRTDALFGGRFADLQFKESLSAKQPFRRMLVKLKREIITMKKPAIRPEHGRAPSVDAPTLKAWLDRGHDDEGRPVVMLDTRNAFEVDVGTFDDALDYRITKFSEFPEVIENNRADLEGVAGVEQYHRLAFVVLALVEPAFERAGLDARRAAAGRLDGRVVHSDDFALELDQHAAEGLAG